MTACNGRILGRPFCLFYVSASFTERSTHYEVGRSSPGPGRPGGNLRSPEIRNENESDVEVIRTITEAAFREMPYAGGDEQDVIDRLRAAGVLSLSLVAIIDQEVVGHVAFSPAVAGDDSQPWFALGPVSVRPDLQRQGIGSKLIESGLAQVDNLGALGCILTGNPEYYKKFGFALSPENAPPTEPKQFFMIRLLKSSRAVGPFAFHAAFYGDGQ